MLGREHAVSVFVCMHLVFRVKTEQALSITENCAQMSLYALMKTTSQIFLFAEITALHISPVELCVLLTGKNICSNTDSNLSMESNHVATRGNQRLICDDESVTGGAQ